MSDTQASLKNMHMENKAQSLAQEVINRHDKLSRSPNREIIEKEMKRSFLDLQKQGKINIEKLLAKTHSQSHEKLAIKEH
jgi:hypothetical protein